MQYPIKNLLAGTEGFLHAQQFNYNMPLNTIGSTFLQTSSEYFEVKGPYEFEMTALINNRNAMVIVPVKPNTVYKPSCETNGDVHIFFLDSSRATSTIVYDTINQNKTAKSPANAAYAQVYLTNRGLGPGKYYFKNWQLEEVSADNSPATPFQPYELGMKQNPYIKDVVYPGISGSSHVSTAANVYSVKDDVTVGKCQVSIATTGIFKVAIYEWVDGSGRIGDPLYQKDVTYDSTGVFTYDFGGVPLKAGKNYWIGRYEDTGGAAANRTLGADGIKGTYKHVDWLGGTSYSSSNMAYPTTYYYFYGLEFETVDLKPAKEYTTSKGVNSIPLIASAAGAGTTVTTDYSQMYNGQPMNRLEVIDVTGSQAKYRGINFYADSGKTYYLQTIIFDPSGVYRYSNLYNSAAFRNDLTGNMSALITDLGGGYSLLEAKFTSDFTGYMTHGWLHYIVVGQNYKMWFGESTVQEGKQKRYESGMKFAQTYPEKNLIPDFNDPRWFDDMSIQTPATVTIYSDNPYGMRMVNTLSAQGRLIWIPVETGKTYTFSFGKITGLYRMYKRKVGNHDVAMVLVQHAGIGLPETFSFTVDESYNGYITLRLTYGGAGTIYFENLQLEEGGPTQFEKMSLTKMKPAKLYPKKNLLPEMPLWTYTNATGKISFPKAYRLEMNGDTAGLYYNQHTEVKYGFSYTVSAGYLTDNARVAIREVKANGSKVFVSNLIPSQMSYTVKPAIDTVKLEVDCTTNGTGFMIFENVQLEEGTVATPFEPYELTALKPN
jgi:hypothetical protein